ncbi:hypothetical protein BT96DRAFT_970387 [Gymnopus androsaceus JB14]|uniref:Uncharacterized protein n=1 Tax=Gymnopus androsaceus JB14 TaxID=1447944 RepID=A0A6A4IEB8_9AGAR|nr:hypothetical protein BT96DRAFT_970387 [Gymnopus androsaceus JB14]
MQDPYSGRFTWHDRDFSKWELAEPQWQRFCQHWLDPENHGAFQHTSFPHSLTIYPKNMAPILPACTVDKILVLDSYSTMFGRLSKRYIDRPRTGAVIIGQPGIGKSIFVCYLLVKLLALPETRRAPIIFHYETTVLLFYHDKVYRPKSHPFQFDRLPERLKVDRIWALIDMGDRREEPWGLGNAFAHRSDLTANHLPDSWGLQDTFKTRNAQILAWVEGSRNHGLPKEHVRVLEQARSYCVATQILFEFATATFGFSARDIYTFFDKPDTLFDAHKTVLVHDHNAEALLSETYNFVRGFRNWERIDEQREGLRLSHQTIAIDVQCIMDGNVDAFRAKFKSEVMLSRMIEKGSPDTATLAGQVFEGYVHRKICQGVPVLSLQSMPFPSKDYHIFPILPRQQVKYVNDRLPKFVLAHYYIPCSSRNLLFNSFFFSEEGDNIILWILKASMEVVDHGSAAGYPYIMAVWRIVRDQFKRPVQIRYLLVRHEHFPERVPQWILPAIPTELPKEILSAEMYYLGLPLPDSDLEAAEDKIAEQKESDGASGSSAYNKSRFIALRKQLREKTLEIKKQPRNLEEAKPKPPRTKKLKTPAVTEALTSAAPYQLRSRGAKEVPKRDRSEVEDDEVVTKSRKRSRK